MKTLNLKILLKKDKKEYLGIKSMISQMRDCPRK